MIIVVVRPFKLPKHCPSSSNYLWWNGVVLISCIIFLNTLKVVLWNCTMRLHDSSDWMNRLVLHGVIVLLLSSNTCQLSVNLNLTNLILQTTATSRLITHRCSPTQTYRITLVDNTQTFKFTVFLFLQFNLIIFVCSYLFDLYSTEFRVYLCHITYIYYASKTRGESPTL